MRIFLNLFICLVFFSTCRNDNSSSTVIVEKESPSPIITSPSKRSHDQIIAPALLEKVNIQLVTIDQATFEATPHPEADFLKSQVLCLQSNGYKNDEWQGLNDCSWVVEQEVIKKYSKRASRQKDQLLLQMDNGTLAIKHDLDSPKGQTYYRLRDYFPTSNYYLIEEVVAGACIRSKLINANNRNQFNVKGQVSCSGDETHLLSYYLSSNNDSDCLGRLEYYQLNDEGLDKKWYLPLSNKAITALKYISSKKVLISTRPNGQPDEALQYSQLTWQ